MTDRMRSSFRPNLSHPSFASPLACIALAAALQSGSAWAVEPFVLLMMSLALYNDVARLLGLH